MQRLERVNNAIENEKKRQCPDPRILAFLDAELLQCLGDMNP